MHVIVALPPICTVVFFGKFLSKMGRDRGLAVENMMETYFLQDQKCLGCMVRKLSKLSHVILYKISFYFSLAVFVLKVDVHDYILFF